MTLEEFLALTLSEERWRGITRLPWHDEAFSRRMLREHLSQSHDGASRRIETIDDHVRWIHERVLQRRPQRVLDLGCGPGLYTQRLAALGHTCTGIDIAPASIEHAREHAVGDRELYAVGDVTDEPFEGEYDLIMMVHGEFNVLGRADAASIVERAAASLAGGGSLLLEVHPHHAVRAIGLRPRAWSAMQAGLFGDSPHLRLDESRWEESTNTAFNLHWIFDGESGQVERHGTATHAYDDKEYVSLLNDSGLARIETYPTLDGETPDGNYLVLVASR